HEAERATSDHYLNRMPEPHRSPGCRAHVLSTTRLAALRGQRTDDARSATSQEGKQTATRHPKTRPPFSLSGAHSGTNPVSTGPRRPPQRYPLRWLRRPAPSSDGGPSRWQNSEPKPSAYEP